MKKVFIILLKMITVTISAVLLVGFTINLVSKKIEKGKIESYGQYVTVDGKNINVVIQGEGEETVVLLPGFATASPGIDFAPLVEELSPYYKVVVIEPFGYGLSDVTKKERSVDNLVKETHEALQQLNIDSYILMGHSIFGVYGLEYVNQFKNEVRAFVGIDSSVPTQEGMDEFPATLYQVLEKTGFLRLITNVDPNPLVPPNVDDKTKEQMQLITHQNMMNPSIINEGKNFGNNAKATENLTFPKNLPVLFFLAEDDTQLEGWEAQHAELIKDSMHGKMISLKGGHYLHHTKSKEIAESFRTFMGEVE